MPDSRPRLFNIPKEIPPIERDMTKLENAFLESMSKGKSEKKTKSLYNLSSFISLISNSMSQSNMKMKFFIAYYVKSVPIWGVFWSVCFRIRTEWEIH